MKTNEFKSYTAKSGRVVMMRKWSDEDIIITMRGKNGQNIRECHRVTDDEAEKTFDMMKNLADLPLNELKKVKVL